jgi:hypothetical protein
MAPIRTHDDNRFLALGLGFHQRGVNISFRITCLVIRARLTVVFVFLIKVYD